MTNKVTLEEIERLSEGRTPGNWRVAPVGDYVNGGINIDAGTGGYICLVDGSAEFPIEHSRADANLIAHAPRLLEICREQAAELVRRPHVGSCVWSLVKTIDDVEWSSTCGHEWQFLEGGPKENEVKFCPFCGGEIEIEQPG